MARKSQDQISSEKDIAQFEKNYALDTGVAERALKFFFDHFSLAKISRKSKEQEWLEDLQLWDCQLTDAQMYVGRSNIFIPEMHKEIEATVAQFQSGLFPDDDYIHAIPLKDTKADEAQMVQEAVFHELDQKNNLPALSERFQRQKVMFGTAFYKPIFEKKMKKIVIKSDKGYNKIVEVPQFEGVRVLVPDTFHTYVWPENANNEQDAVFVADEAMIPKYDLEQSNLYANLEDVAELPRDFGDFGWVDSVRLTAANLGAAMNQRPMGAYVVEMWCDFDIRPGVRVPCVLTIANLSTVIQVRRNPFWHQMKPYCMGRYIKAPAGEVYGHSLPERLRSLQYMINDLGNQTMDSLTWSLNPIALIDPGFAGDVNSFKLQPGAKWFASPQGVEFKFFPDVSGAGMQGMQQIRSMIQQFSDNAPQVAPQLSGKVRSATQSQAVTNEITNNLKNMVRSDEYEVMSPLCYMTQMLLRQYQDKQYQVTSQGPEKGQWITKMVNPYVLHKDISWVWRGSDVAEKTAVRSQQLLQGFNMALQVQSLMPGEIDLPKFFKRVMYEAFNLKDLGIFTKDQDKLTVDPDIENLALDSGEDVDVNPGDNYDLHMKSHEAGLEKTKTDESKLAYLRHLEKHKLQKQATDALQQQQAQVAAMQTAVGPGGGGDQGGPQGQPPGGGQGPVQGQPGFSREGNPFQAPAASTFSQVAQGIRPTQNKMPRGIR